MLFFLTHAYTGINTIAHHHDFFWERKRFLHNCVWDILNSCYPPNLNAIHHVVINSSVQDQLALRTGIAATLLPNVLNFEKSVEPPDEYARDVRKALRVGEDELLILQRTLVISHASGDEGYEYEQRVRQYAQMLEVKAIFVNKIIDEKRGRTEDGRKVYSLQDIYPHADLITYPSVFEGFGNSFNL